MNEVRKALILIVACAVVTELHAEPIATHTGARNPLSEGWKKYRSFKDVETVPIKNDSGTKVDAWCVYDNGRGDGVYGHAVKWPKTINGKDPGWRLTLKIRVVAAPQEPKGALMAGVVHNGRSYTISFAKANEGYPIVELGREGAVTRVVLDDVDKWYHTYELEFDPKENNAKLLVDGKVRAQHYAGYDELIHNVDNVYFGSTASEDTGKANYALVKFEIVPQP